MQNLLLSLFAVLILSACNNSNDSQTPVEAEPPAKALSESDRLNQWFEERYEEELAFSPIQLTMQGRKDRYDEIDEFTDASMDKFLQWKEKSVQDMHRQFNKEALTDDAKLSWDLWEYQYQGIKADVAMRRNDYIFHQMSGVQSFLPTFMISFHRVESLDDMNAYVARLSGVARAVNQLVELAKAGIAEGVRPPRFAYEIASEQAQSIISGAPFTEGGLESPIWADVREELDGLVKRESISAEQADKILAQARSVLTDEVQPAYQNLIDFIAGDMPNTSDEAQGVSALPNGEAYYKHRLAAMTTTYMTADEIHQLGLAEVARLRGEMEQVKEATGFTGSLQEFFSFVRDSQDNPTFYYANDDIGRQAYLDDATAAIENIKGQLPNYFGILPKADLEVKRVESFREQDGAPQHYYPGTPDGSRPGIYYAHLSDMKAMPKAEMEVIAYHEGLPGHHMQIAIAQELQGIPTFRTQAGFAAYSEGWGLYSELLATEMPDTYLDLYSQFGRLGSEMWRAIRLVVDTGLHAKGWSQQQAIDYFASNSPAAQAAIEAEIRRYLVIPGQATSYKVGMLHILKLRKMAEQAFGDEFDIRTFHDVILGSGALPLKMLERRVQQWIDAETASSTVD